MMTVESVTRIRDPIAASYIFSLPTNCQSQHINAVNHTNSRSALSTQHKNQSKLISALNLRTNQLLPSNAVFAAHVQVKNISNMSASNTSPQILAGST